MARFQKRNGSNGGVFRGPRGEPGGIGSRDRPNNYRITPEASRRDFGKNSRRVHSENAQPVDGSPVMRGGIRF